MGSLNGELAATEGLGLLLQNPVAGAALIAKVRAGAPDLPADLTFSTQAGDSDGRPDIVGRDGTREVLQVEGKFWAGLTKAQLSGAYLERMRRQHTEGDASSAHIGVLVYVVPPRRIAGLVGELQEQHHLVAGRQVSGWHFWDADAGLVVGLASWRDVVEPLARLSDSGVAEDARQLLALVEQVDNSMFVPWSDEQRSDQETPRRIRHLAGLLQAVHSAAVRDGIATKGKRYTITEGGPLAYGLRMNLGEVICTLRLSLGLWGEHGRSPAWLSFGSGAPVARRAFPSQVVDYRGGVAMPVPLQAGALEHEVVEQMTAWLASTRQGLAAAIRAGARPSGTDEEGELPLDDV
ncbi:hypothetical protein ACI78T_17180 [Blastococcus sp. SYSU D00922]